MPRGKKGSGRPKYKSRATRCAEAVESLRSVVIDAESGWEDATEEEREELVQNLENARDECVSQLQDLQDEMANWRDNMSGTNLESTEKYERVDQAANDLEDLVSTLESWVSPDLGEESLDVSELMDACDTGENVDFPTMFG